MNTTMQHKIRLILASAIAVLAIAASLPASAQTTLLFEDWQTAGFGTTDISVAPNDALTGWRGLSGNYTNPTMLSTVATGNCLLDQAGFALPYGGTNTAGKAVRLRSTNPAMVNEVALQLLASGATSATIAFDQRSNTADYRHVVEFSNNIGFLTTGATSGINNKVVTLATLNTVAADVNKWFARSYTVNNDANSPFTNACYFRIRKIHPNPAGGGVGGANGIYHVYDNLRITAVLPPTITGAATATAFTTTYGSASAAQTFPIGGTNLTTSITATAPSSFEVSNDGITYAPTATFTQSGGTASGNLRIRLAATAPVAGTYDGQNIVLSSTGATAVNITTAASGNGVTAKALTVTATGPLKPFGTALTAGTSATDFTATGLVNGETVTSVTLTPDAAGLSDTTPLGDPYLVTPSDATGAGGFLTGNYAITYVDYSGNVGTSILSVSNSPQTYTGSPQAATVTNPVAGTVSNVMYDGSPTVPTNVGTYAVTADFTPTDTVTYSSLTGAPAGNFVIQKATPTATLAVNNSPETYDGSAKSATVGITVSSVPGTVANILTGGAATQTGTNTYAVTADFVPTDTANYNSLIAQAAGNFVIQKATPTATLAVNNSPVTYDTSAKAATVIVSASSVPGTAANILTGGSATQTNAGTYAVTADFVPTDTTNYNTLTAQAAGDFEIQKANPVLTVGNTPVVYDGSAKAATINSVPGGVASNILTGGLASQTNAGTYAVTADFVPTDTDNFNSLIAQAAGNFVIQKATPTATLAVNNSPETYDGSAKSATVGITASSVPGTVANILTGGAATQTNAGTYAVTAGFVPTDTDNYNSLIAQAAGNFVIQKATPTATLAVNNSPVTYDTSAKAATVIVSTSSAPGAAANILTGGSATQTNADTYAVTADFVPTDTSNYNTITALSAGNFVIGKADQTISFTLASPVLLSAGTVSLSATSTSGLTVSFASSNPAIADVSGSTLNLNEGGSITVTASQAGDGNYNAATNVPQSLVITDDSAPPTLAILQVVTAAAYNSGSNTTSVTVEFSGEPDKTYQIVYSTDLMTWSTPSGYPTGATGTFQATFTSPGDVAAAWSTRMFFRASR